MFLSLSRNRSDDLLHSSCSRALISYSLPLLGSSLIQLLYDTVDLIYIGQFLGTTAAAAIGTCALFIACLIGFFSGLSIGASILTARYYGQHNTTAIIRLVYSAIGISLISGLFLSILGYITAPFFILHLNTPPSIAPLAISYLQVYLCSAVWILLYNICSGIIRVTGDSRSPLYFQFIGGVINVVADALCICVWELGISGAAWATFLSQGAAGCLCLYYLWKQILHDNTTGSSPRWDSHAMYAIFRLGIPAGLQSVVMTASNIFIQYHINSLGTSAMAAFTAYFKLELLLYFPIIALGQAVLIFTGQNLGANLPSRARKGMRTSLFLGIMVTEFIAAFVLYLGTYAFYPFTTDIYVISDCLRIVVITLPFYGLYVILEVYGAVLRSIGCVLTPMTVILINFCMLRMACLLLFFPSRPEITTLAAIYPFTWFTAALSMYLCYRWKYKASLSARTYLSP
ncbi:MATE family efflux transporter [uncultured Megasphaera sp.]|uniref:MATE family efflux transporter n=1 Tax=uncultured Megasphaera sp. TaxID=165188 RepID=UPI0037832DD8